MSNPSSNIFNKAEQIFIIKELEQTDNNDYIETKCEEIVSVFDSIQCEEEIHVKQEDDWENMTPEVNDHLYKEIQDNNKDFSSHSTVSDNTNTDVKYEIFLIGQNTISENLSYNRTHDEEQDFNRKENIQSNSTEKNSVFDPKICNGEIIIDTISDCMSADRMSEANGNLNNESGMKILNYKCPIKLNPIDELYFNSSTYYKESFERHKTYYTAKHCKYIRSIQNYRKGTEETCAVKNCNSTFRNGFQLYQFSDYYIYHKEWIINCELSPNTNKNIFICERHFLSRYIYCRILKRKAIPTLNLNVSLSKNVEINNTPPLATYPKKVAISPLTKSKKRSTADTKKKLRCYEQKKNVADNLNHIKHEAEQNFTIEIISEECMEKDISLSAIGSDKTEVNVTNKLLLYGKNSIVEDLSYIAKDDKPDLSINNIKLKENLNDSITDCRSKSCKELEYQAKNNHKKRRHSYTVSAKRCVVKSCYATRKDAKLYRFNKRRHYKQWIQNCQITSSKIKNNFICSRHFESHYFGKRGLKANAIPTLNLDINRENENQVIHTLKNNSSSSLLNHSDHFFSECNTSANKNSSSHVKNSDYSNVDTESDSDISVYMVYDKDSDKNDCLSDNDHNKINKVENSVSD